MATPRALLHRTAAGHVVPPGGDPMRVPFWVLPRSSGPAGLITASAADVLDFAALHLAGGRTPDGDALLSPESVVAMQQPQAEVPDPFTFATPQWGLGWFLPRWGDRTLYGHDGGTVGQSSVLRVLPEDDLAICLMVNGGRAVAPFGPAVLTAVAGELAGVVPPRRPTPPEEPVEVDLDRFVGTYEQPAQRIEVVRADDGGLQATMTRMGTMLALMPGPPQVAPLSAVDADGTFVAHVPGAPEPIPLVLYRFDADGRPGYLHFGMRTHPRRP